MIFKFPLTAEPQTFQISLLETNYNFTLKWNDSIDGGWVFDLSYSDTDEPVLANAPLVTGVDILSGLEYLGIGGKIYAYTDGNSSLVPTYTNLGTDSNLYFETT